MSEIFVVPNAIPQITGAKVTVTGSGFSSNGTIMVNTSDGAQLVTVKADGTGSFAVVLTYSEGSKTKSALAQVIADNQVRNFVYIQAWDDSSKRFSDVVPLYY